MGKSAKNAVKNVNNSVNNGKNKEKYFYSEEEDNLIVSSILSDFEERKQERKPYDLAWELNINFLIGNQFSYISDKGEVEKSPKQYYWQGEEVFNHISPIIESRLAKLGKVRPTFAVKPSGSEERDLYCANLSKNILSTFAAKHKLSAQISNATVWSEICGTAFYKVLWDNELGTYVGDSDDEKVMLGDASICVCSPFEIFPDSSSTVDFENMQSLIHARAIPARVVEDNYNIKVQGKDIDTFSFDQGSSTLTYTGRSNIQKLTRQVKHDHVLVIERYEKPNKENPNGKLTIIAGDKLVHDGELPFINGVDGKREFPFIRQISTHQIGSFWGVSVIERCIPIQRAYNTVKNRKHEFMARLASGVLAVEDGSVDIDLIEEEGIAPGKIIVYRNGSTPPAFINPGSIPNDFDSEEDRLLNEFISISGVSELMRDSSVPSTVSSGTALSLLIEQDDTRLSVTAENIRDAVVKIAENVIALYKQFASVDRLIKVSDENGKIETFYWNNSDISFEEVVLESVNELTESPAQRRSLLFDLYKSGIFTGDDGKISQRTKAKIIDALGFNSFESIEDLSSLHIKKAVEENLKLNGEVLAPADFDDHEIHIAEHTKYLLSSIGSQNETQRKNIQNHILEHRVLFYANTKTQAQNEIKFK